MATTVVEKPFFLTTIGKKYLMGITGLIWAGFVLTHMIGNMLLLVSADAYNQYSHALTSTELIYVAEAGLVAAFLVHVICAISLTLENRAARGDQRYAMTPNGEKGVRLASKTMAIHGSILLVFLITHIATFKYGTIYDTTVKGVPMRDLARLVFEVFQQPGYVVWYVISLLFLFLHLSHGVGSSFQSLGWKKESIEKPIKCLSWAYAAIVVAGFLSQPLYAYFGSH